MSSENIIEFPTEQSLVLSRVFNTPRKLVYAAFTEKKHIDQWMAPRDFVVRDSGGDLRVGGKWFTLMIAPDGERFPMSGIYKKIVPDELLVTSHVWEGDDGLPEHETQLTFRFEDAGAGKTKVTLEQSNYKSIQSRDSHSEGWSGCFNKLADVLGHVADAAEVASDREILVSRVFDAPRDLVWEAMANPKHLIHWWGPVGFTNTIEVMDLTPGGVWKHVMHGPDGKNYPNDSIFTQVVKPEVIAYEHKVPKFVATWSFEALSDRQTRLTVRMVFGTSKERETVVRNFGAIEGAHQTLARLAELLAKPFNP